MRRRRVFASIFVTLATLGACGGSSDDGGGGGSISLDDLPKRLAEAECKTFEKCFGPLIEIYLNGEDCLTLTEKSIANGGLGDLKAAVESGSVTYDGQKAAACLSEIENRSCDSLTERTVEACDQASEGNVDVGGNCTHGFECKGTAFCKFSGACPGKCTDRQSAGASCTEDDQCADGLVCSDDTSACVKPAAQGEACGGGSAPPCNPALICAGETENSQGTCRPFDQVFVGKSGAACGLNSGTLCEVELSCVIDDVQQLTGTCQAKASSGGACKRAAIPGHCPTGEYCDGEQLDGTCKLLPTVGQPCATLLGGEQGCASYARCVNGTCQALSENGTACTTDASCYSESCVNSVCRANDCAG